MHHQSPGTELYLKYRPTTLKGLVGQTKSVQMLEQLVKDNKVPHALLFSGPSGIGKTSVARILKSILKCSDRDYYEINASSSRGIDTIRDIDEKMNLSPWGGPCTIYVLDECHQLTKRKGGDAQSALLKMLEDTPRHVYFFLATTHPGDLLPTILTRCTKIKFNSISDKALEGLVLDVCKKEKIKLEEEVVDKLVATAGGSARECLVLLHQIVGIEGVEDQLDCIQSSDTQAQAIALARALMNTRVKWPEVAKILKSLEDEPETIRQMVLSYANSVLIGGKGNLDRAYLVIQAFRDNYYECGKAGLAASCYEVVAQK